MAEPRRAPIRLLVGASLLLAAGCTTITATASRGGVSVDAERRAEARVQYVQRVGCADRSTEAMAVEAVYGKADAWADRRRDPDYVPPEADYQAPLVRYPKSELVLGTAEAVLVVIFTNPDGSVASSEPVCSTREVFNRYALATVADNRYVAARVGDAGVRGVAFQTIIFSTYD